MATAPPAQALLRSMTEDDLQSFVLDCARVNGWLAFHTRGRMKGHVQGRRGFPDLVLVGYGRVLYRELKTMTGLVDEDQLVWIGALTRAGADVDVWRPADVERIKRELARDRLL